MQTEINKWVESQTANRITDIIPPGLLDSLTRMVLVNAIYFKGDWKHKFSESSTNKQTFYVKQGVEKQVIVGCY
jgi:serine protease inhibitor